MSPGFVHVQYSKLLVIVILHVLENVTLKYILYYVEKGATFRRFTEDPIPIATHTFTPEQFEEFRSMFPRCMRNKPGK